MTEIRFDTAFGSYYSISVLGEGGSGRVYKVRDSDGKIYAIKCLTKSTKEKRKRFKNEISFCQSNTHKNIVTVQNHGIVQMGGEECPFYVMPCYPGTLRDLMMK